MGKGGARGLAPCRLWVIVDEMGCHRLSVVGCCRRNGEGRGSWVFALLVVGCRRRNGLSSTVGCGLL
jgi:hypothetical protein